MEWVVAFVISKEVGGREMAHSVKCLLGKHEKYSNPITEVKARLGGMFLSPRAGEAEP